MQGITFDLCFNIILTLLGFCPKICFAEQMAKKCFIHATTFGKIGTGQIKWFNSYLEVLVVLGPLFPLLLQGDHSCLANHPDLAIHLVHLFVQLHKEYMSLLPLYY